MGPKCYAVQCTVGGEETPQNCPVPWDFITLPEDDRIGNMHRKIGTDCTCGSRDILVDRQAHRQTDRRAHHSTLPHFQLPRGK